ncbi:LCP family protein [Parablautia muri]
MKSKKKRDALADQEKERLLNPEKLKEKKKKKIRKIALMVLVEVAVVTVMVCMLFQIVRAVGRNNLLSKAQPAPELTPVIASEPLSKEEEEKWQQGWVKYKEKVYAYNEDIMTFLVMGIDKNSDVKEMKEGTDGGQADALFLAVMNPHDKSIKVIGINRNTMTDIDVYNEEGAYVNTITAQIAVQHGFGNGVEESCEYQKKAVQKLFYNLPIHGYAAVNMSAIPAVNDAVGGVDVTVLEDLTSKDKSLKEGERVHLEGESAYWYVKYRDTSIFASADLRLARQKQYLTAFIDEAKHAVKNNLSVALELYQNISPQMVTDVSLDEVSYLAPIIVDYSFGSDSFRMLEGETIMGEEFEEFWADEEALYELIIDVFYEEVSAD